MDCGNRRSYVLGRVSIEQGMYSNTSEENRANRYSAEEERGRLLLVTTVDLGDGLTDKIELRAGDCPEVIKDMTLTHDAIAVHLQCRLCQRYLPCCHFLSC